MFQTALEGCWPIDGIADHFQHHQHGIFRCSLSRPYSKGCLTTCLCKAAMHLYSIADDYDPLMYYLLFALHSALLQDHYKGYKHQRMLTRHQATMHNQSYSPHQFSHPAYQTSTRLHSPYPAGPQPLPQQAMFQSPVRNQYGAAPDRWRMGPPAAGLLLYSMHRSISQAIFRQCC